MTKCSALVVILFLSGLLKGNSYSDSYINSFKDIAIAEMHRSGIPASIKLAQGLLESNWGRSELAKVANNHFGIKCGGAWDGGTFYKKDDDRNKHGKLIPSCFRAFPNAESSYIAHSEFLTNRGRDSRYHFLFDYDLTDYKSWAKGLLKAGYATDKKYPKKLIQIIEKYNLSQYDNISEDAIIAYTSPAQPSKQEDINVAAENSSRLKSSEINKKQTPISGYVEHSINKVKMTYAQGGETLEQIAAYMGKNVEDLITYNEGYGYGNIILTKGSIIYLKKKKRSYKGKEDLHEVKEGETMFSISQLYGLKLANLYAKNKMPKGSEPITGELLYLQKTAPRKKRPAFIKNPHSDNQVEYLFTEEGVSRQ